MSRIFVSHSSKDRKSAELLGQWLQEQGHASYFLDFDPDKGIAAGKHWEDELYRHLRLCRAVIGLLSPNWLESRWCFAEVTQARAAGKPIFLAKVAPCDADGLFNDIQQVDLTVDATGGYRRLARGLRDVGIKPGDAFEWNPSRPPYPGLLAFEEEDSAIFFGRDRDIQKGLEMLDGLRRRSGPSFILCLGASGSGKSSLMRAGLIPRLRKYSQAWLPVAPCRPQENPLEELAIKLAQTFEALGVQRDWRSIYEQLHAPYSSADWAAAPDMHAVTGEGLTELARDLRVLAGTQEATVILAVDQAEELFGYSDAQRSRAFLQCLRGALERGGHRLMVIATMRSDSLGSFQTHPDLQEFAYEPLTVAPIPLRELPQIIEGPAQVADIALAPGLVQTLVQDATTSDAMPLLAFTLRELYERYGQDRRLEVSEYEELGRLEGAVRRAADVVIKTMSPSAEELAALRVAFVPAMVRVNEEGDFIRRRASWLDLPARAHALLQRFIDSRLLVSRDVDGQRVVEVAHEALLRVWPRLNSWLREDRDNLRMLDDLRHAAEEWQTHGRGESWLAHFGDRLESVEEMVRLPQFGEQVDPVAKGYLEACVKKRRREQEQAERQHFLARVFTVVIAVIAVVAIGAATFGWHQAGVADNEKNQALLSKSKALSSVSREQTDKGQATLGVLLALEALPKQADKDRSFVPSAEAALLASILALREKQILRGHTEGVNNIAFSPKDSLAVTASRDRTARVWEVSSGRTLFTLTGHEGQIYSAEFSPDGKQILTASSDKTARLWNAMTGELSAVLEGHRGYVYQASFSADGNLLVTASHDGTARVWYMSDKGIEGRAVLLQGHAAPVYSAEFSLDGEHVVTASEDGTARIWRLDDKGLQGAPVVLKGHAKPVMHASFSTDGARVVTASLDRTARIWDVGTGESLVALEGHEEGVEQTMFSPNGKLIATISQDSTARLWNGITGDPIAVLTGHRGQVHDAVFSQDSRWLITAAADGTARLWDLASGETLDIFAGHTGGVWSAGLSSDGRLAATVSDDDTARIWEVAPNSRIVELIDHERPVLRTIFAPDGQRLVTVSNDSRARIWDAKNGKLIEVLAEYPGGDWYAVFSKTGRSFLTASIDGTARLWDTVTGDLVREFKGHASRINHAHISPDEQRVVTGGEDGKAIVWDVASGQPVHVLDRHQKAVNIVEFSRDGQRIVTASHDNMVRLWDAGTGKLLRSLEGHRGPVINGAFSPDGARLVTVSWDETARLWDAASGDPLHILEGHEDPVLSATYSPDSRLVVTTSEDNTARIWDAASGESLFVLRGHSADVYEASFSADGRLILTASGDGTARLWHVASGLPVAAFKGHSGAVAGAVFSPDGRYVATASWDHTARLWELPIGTGDDLFTWIKYARQNVPRELTDDERRLYLE